MADNQHEIIRIRFTDSQTVYDWPILDISQNVAIHILTAGGYKIEGRSNESRRNTGMPELLQSRTGKDAEEGKP